MFLEDISGFLSCPQLDDLSSSEPIVDNADFLNDLVDGFEEEEAGWWTMDSEISQERRDSTENKSEKRKRGPGRPANKKSLFTISTWFHPAEKFACRMIYSFLEPMIE